MTQEKTKGEPGVGGNFSGRILVTLSKQDERVYTDFRSVSVEKIPKVGWRIAGRAHQGTAEKDADGSEFLIKFNPDDAKPRSVELFLVSARWVLTEGDFIVISTEDEGEFSVGVTQDKAFNSKASDPDGRKRPVYHLMGPTRFAAENR